MTKFIAWTLTLVLAVTITPLSAAAAEMASEGTESSGIVGDDAFVATENDGTAEEEDSLSADEEGLDDGDVETEDGLSAMNTEDLVEADEAVEAGLFAMAEEELGILDGEHFRFEVTIPEGGNNARTFRIPLSSWLRGGVLGLEASNKAYNWDIDWGDGTQESASHTGGAQGIGGAPNGSDSPGIPHTYQNGGKYIITITPAGSTDAWLAAFGFSSGGFGANAQENKDKVTKLISPITPLMTRADGEDGSVASLPSAEWRYAFRGCTNLEMGSEFTFSGWEGVTAVAGAFAQGMFQDVSGDAFTMGEAFNLPQGITTVGANFAASMFQNCNGNNFAMNDVFNLPKGITNVGNAFAMSMFFNCNGNAFAMNDVFSMPQGIESVGDNFASGMFQNCRGSVFTMNDVFNLPQQITVAGTSFAQSMFQGSGSDAFAMNSRFNLPQNVTSVGSGFVRSMFFEASGESFRINNVFKFPTLAPTQLNQAGVFISTFQNMNSGISSQVRSASSIIGGNALPTSNKNTFTEALCFSDLQYLHEYWGGEAGGGMLSIDNVLVVSHSEMAFPTRLYRYTADDVAPFTFTVYNLGMDEEPDLDVELDNGADSGFVLGLPSDDAIPAGGSLTFTAAPKLGLVGGDYEDYITVSASSGSEVKIFLSFSVVLILAKELEESDLVKSAKHPEMVAAFVEDKVYDGKNTADVTIEIKPDSLVEDLEDVSIKVTAEFADTKAAGDGKDAGEGKEVKITAWSLSGTDKNLYSLPELDSVTIERITADIAKKALTGITVVAESKIYDGNADVPKISAELSYANGVVAIDDAEDEVSIKLDNVAFSSKDADDNISIDYDWSLEGFDAGNYELPRTKPVAQADILHRALIVETGDPKDGGYYIAKTYDGTEDPGERRGEFSIVCEVGQGIVEGEDVNILDIRYPYPEAGVGSYPIDVTISLYGDDAHNYHLADSSLVAVGHIEKASFILQDEVLHVPPRGKASLDVSSLVAEILNDGGTPVYTVTGVAGDDIIGSLNSGSTGRLPSSGMLEFSVLEEAYMGDVAYIAIVISGFDNYEDIFLTVDVRAMEVDAEPVDIRINAADKVYDGAPIIVSATALYHGEPIQGLNFDMLYTLVDSRGATLQGADGEPLYMSSTLPADAGHYRVSASVNTRFYVGTMSRIITVHQRQVRVTTPDIELGLGQAFPSLPLPVSYSGFVGRDTPSNALAATAQAVYSTNPSVSNIYAIYFEPEAELRGWTSSQSGTLAASFGTPASNYRLVHTNGRLTRQTLTSIRLGPTHAKAGDADTPILLEAFFAPEVFDYENIKWAVCNTTDGLEMVEGSEGQWGYMDVPGTDQGTFVPLLRLMPNADNKSVNVFAMKDALDTARTISVSAEYDGRYTARATIEILPNVGLPNEGDLVTSVKVLDSAVTVNRAAERGTFTPILITQQRAVDKGLSGFSPDNVTAKDEQAAVGASLPEIAAMRIVGSNGRPVAGYDVRMTPEDERFVEISADASARSAKNVSLQILRSGIDAKDASDDWIEANWTSDNMVDVTGTFSLTVSDKFPSVTLRLGDLNLAFPTVSTTVTATSTAGSVSIIGINDSTAAFTGNIAFAQGAVSGTGALSLVLREQGSAFAASEAVLTRTGTQKGQARVQVEGFKEQVVNLNVRVVNSQPSVRLSRTSIPLHYVNTEQSVTNPNGLEYRDFVPAVINLLSGVRTRDFEDNYKVKDVGLNPDHAASKRMMDLGYLSVDYSQKEPGVIRLTPKSIDISRSLQLRVVFEDPAFGDDQDNPDSFTNFRNLSLTVNMIQTNSLNITNRATPTTVNRNHVGMPHENEAVVREIPIGLNAANIALDDWAIQGDVMRTGSTRASWLNEAERPPLELLDGNGDVIPPVQVVPYIDTNETTGVMTSGIRLVANRAALEDLMERGKLNPYNPDTKFRNMTYRMNIGSNKIRTASGTPRTFAVNLTFTDNNASFTVSLNSRTRIDVANPESFQTATVRLKNTTSEIDMVRLYPTASNSSRRDVESNDFRAVVTGAYTFNIMKSLSNDQVVPRVAQRLSVQIVLRNGQVLNSWTELDSRGRNTDRTISVNPVQAIQKPSARAVTLYRAQPLHGDSFQAQVGVPANASFGVAVIDQNSLNNIRFGKAVVEGGTINGYEKYGSNPARHGGLVLDRVGETGWTLSFEDGAAPARILDRNFAVNGRTSALKASYTVRVELWAKGTYKLDESGNAVINANGKVEPLRDIKGKARSVPTVYNVRVNLR
ncbi:MAG: YDG domain-containing protein [Clostridiales bacterium]|nr:YDG domain-containing protein [Clostridiales bacterium]